MLRPLGARWHGRHICRPYGARAEKGAGTLREPDPFSALLAFLCPLERGFDRIAQHVQHVNASGPLVLRRNQMPRRELGTGPLDHVVDRVLVGVPFLAVAPVFFRDLEALERCGFALLEAAQLFFFADLQPEFHGEVVGAVRVLMVSTG